jgi:hypothetical protein
MVTPMTSYSPEQCDEIMRRAREALEAAEVSLAAPRPEIEPPAETRSQRWQREANERERTFARERRARTLTETEAARLEARLVAQIGSQLGEQKGLVLQIVAGVVAELQAEFAERLEKLAEELGQVRAELTINKALNNKSGGEIVDLPTLPLRKRA